MLAEVVEAKVLDERWLLPVEAAGCPMLGFCWRAEGATLARGFSGVLCGGPEGNVIQDPSHLDML